MTQMTHRNVGMKRLDHLADFLFEKVQDDWFDLKQWATSGFPYKECGTTACAIGWCPAAFPRSWEWGTVHGSRPRPKLKQQAFQDFSSWSYVNAVRDHGMKFFALDRTEFDYLFMPEGYAEDRQSRRIVAGRIKAFVKRGGLPKSRQRAGVGS